MTVKLRATLPENHGLTDRHGRAGECVTVVALLEPFSATHFENGDPPAYTFSVGYIEVIEGADVERVERMRLAAYQARTGEVPLPLDGE